MVDVRSCLAKGDLAGSVDDAPADLDGLDELECHRRRSLGAITVDARLGDVGAEPPMFGCLNV